MLFELWRTQQVGFLWATNLWHCPYFASTLNINSDSWGGIERVLRGVCVEFDLCHVKTNKAFNWVFWGQRKFIEQLLVTQQNSGLFSFLKSWWQGGENTNNLRICFLYSYMNCDSSAKVYSCTGHIRLFSTIKPNGSHCFKKYSAYLIQELETMWYTVGKHWSKKCHQKWSHHIER